MTVRSRVESIAIIVGAVVGAGFATGSEINLYFRGKSLWSPAISALFFGGLTALFLFAGKKEESAFMRLVSSVLVTTSALVTFCAMAGCFAELFGSKVFGVVISVVCVVLARRSAWLGPINLVLVAVIAVLVIFCALPPKEVSGTGLGVGSALTYACLNFMTAGALIRRVGARADTRDVIAVSTGVFAVMAVLTCAMYTIVWNTNGVLPFLTVAGKRGVFGLAVIVVLLAVFTTQLATSAVIVEAKIFSDVPFGVRTGVLGALAVFGCTLGFENVLALGYPLVSAFGLVYVLITAYETLKKRGARIVRHKVK